MCGHIGVIGDIWGKDKRVFELLLKFDTVRGPHSTGIARVTTDNEVQVVKGVGTPWHLSKAKQAEYYNDIDPKADELKGSFKVLMGHNRWATVGAVNEENAHPFQQHHITGAHNGTLDAYCDYRLEKMDRFETDSEGLFYNIAAQGLKDAMSKTSGAWCLAWWDSNQKSFNLLRNNERPLFYTTSESGKTLYYASENWMLDVALARVGIKRGDIVELPVDTHHKFDFSDNYNVNIETETVKGWTYSARNFTVVGGGRNAYVNTSTVELTDSSLTDLSHMVGQYKTFEVSTIFTDEHSTRYVSGWLDEHTDVEVRIYCPFEGELYNLLDDDGVITYEGCVKEVGYGQYGMPYVIMHNDTIADADENFQYSPDMKGVSLTTESRITVDHISASLNINDEIPWLTPEEMIEFENKTKHGCCWCSYVPEPKDASSCRFMSDGQFLCADCNDNKDVTQYVANYYR